MLFITLYENDISARAADWLRVKSGELRGELFFRFRTTPHSTQSLVSCSEYNDVRILLLLR